MHYRIVFNGNLFQTQANALRHAVAQALLQADFEGATLVLSSEGGSTDEGLALYNFLRALPKPITIHAAGHVGSMAVPFFCGGHRRTCSPFSRFFFHTYDWGFDGRQTLNRITEAVQRLTNDIELSRNIVAKHTNIPAKTLQRYYGTASSPTVMSPDQAQKVGLVEDILDLPDGDGNVTMWTVGW